MIAHALSFDVEEYFQVANLRGHFRREDWESVPLRLSVGMDRILSLLDRDTTRAGADQDMRLLALFADQAAMALESVRSFNDLGRVLLGAVAAAAEGDGDLAEAARLSEEQLDGPDADLAALAATFAVLVRYAVRYYEHTSFFGHESDADVVITPAMALIMPGVVRGAKVMHTATVAGENRTVMEEEMDERAGQPPPDWQFDGELGPSGKTGPAPKSEPEPEE